MLKTNKKENKKVDLAKGVVGTVGGLALLLVSEHRKTALDARFNKGENPLEYLDDIANYGTDMAVGSFVVGHYFKKLVNTATGKKVFK